ncbi:TIGR04206 family protein [Haloarcula sp. S1CR25-12]|uniref:TIGR04206 family protein n=1 Tax=Haloarcula saliterrae TaxID=2950534 RepID=A0ABU2F858_9EURY|nr:TIGR04206 family protein [Haloarcula sp. S1CR25-12]MDS0258429.1 TIGR04206 family protein [Haloarcula sp. S1CR25-12]
MAWVKSEYAGELAVLSTWLVAIAPWSVSLFGGGQFTGVVFRFLPFRLQYLFGISVPNELTFLWAWEAATIQQGPTTLAAYLWTAVVEQNYTVLAGLLWTVGLAVFAVAFLASVVYYVREERFAAALPLDPVRLFGGLLGLVGLLTVVGTVFLNLTGGFAGTTVPVGALFAPVLSYLLLTVDRA